MTHSGPPPLRAARPSHAGHLHVHLPPIDAEKLGAVVARLRAAQSPPPRWRLVVDRRDWALPFAAGRDSQCTWLGFLCIWLRKDRGL